MLLVSGLVAHHRHRRRLYAGFTGLPAIRRHARPTGLATTRRRHAGFTGLATTRRRRPAGFTGLAFSLHLCNNQEWFRL